VSKRGGATGEQHRGQRGLHTRRRPGPVGDGEQPAASACAAFWLLEGTRPFPGADASVTSAGISACGFQIHGPATETQDGLLLPAPTALCPAAAGQIRKTCGVPAYLRVVIESHRTQASRTINAETTAQAITDRVD
jgi:hypothetical protein